MRNVPGLLIAVALLAACGENASQPTIVPQLSIIAGNAQIDTIGKVLPTQIAAALRDKESGAPLAGRIVNWVVIEGGGQVFAPVVQTGADGIARQTWTLGMTTGRQRVVARWIDPATGEPLTLDTASATAMPAHAVSFMVAFGGSNQLAVGDTATILYWYRDQYGNRNAPCADGGAGDRVLWTSADSTAVRPLGNAMAVPDGWATQVVALAVRTPGIDVRGHALASCAPQDSLAGVSFLVR